MRFYTNYSMKKGKTRKNGTNPLYVRLTLNQKRAELSTGIFVNPNDWDEVKQQIDPHAYGAIVFNNRLQKITTDIYDIYNQLVSVGKTFDISAIKSRFLGVRSSVGFLEIFDYYLRTIETNIGKGYAYRTLKHYKVSRKKLAEFINSKLHRKDTPLTEVNYDFLNKFDMYIKSEYNVHQNTAWNYHKHLRRVLNLAISMDHLAKNPYYNYKVKLEQAHREFLTRDELKKIESKKIELIRMSIVRDVFVFACYTGLSYADISKLNSGHIQKRDDGNKWIIINRTKTNTKCYIPLFPNTIEILNKYADFPQALLKGRVLPVSTNQNLNSYLKELAEICGIQKNLTMHVARHTFATTVTLSNGVPIETVSKILGHSSLKVTQIYARVLENKISEDMNTLKGKLGM